MASYGDIKFATRGGRKSIKGLEWPVRAANTGGMFSNNYNENAVKDGLIQLLLTSRGERPMRLDFGTNLRASVFEPLDGATVSDLKSSVLDAIAKYEKRVVIRSFDIHPDISTSRLDIDLVFSLKSDVLSHHQILLSVDTQGVSING
jgi:phage baseplate assembly protein W